MTNIDYWLQEFTKAWTETGGIGLAQHQLAIYIEIKLGAKPCQGPPIPHACHLPNADWQPPLNDCQEILAQVHGIRADLQENPLLNTDTT